jgi:hypothetical protein
MLIGANRPELRRKILAALKASTIQRGTAHVVTVRHDDWCTLLVNGGDCSWNPEIILEKAKK